MSTISKLWRRLAPSKSVQWLEDGDVLYTHFEIAACDKPLEREAELGFLAEAQWVYNPAEYVLAFTPLQKTATTENHLLAIAHRSALERVIVNGNTRAAHVFWQIPDGVCSVQGEEQVGLAVRTLRFYPDYRAEREAANQRFYGYLLGVCVLVCIAMYGWVSHLEDQSRSLETQLVHLQKTKQAQQKMAQGEQQRQHLEQAQRTKLFGLDAKMTKLTQPLNTPAFLVDTIHYDGAGFHVQGAVQDLAALARSSAALPGASLHAQAHLSSKPQKYNEIDRDFENVEDALHTQGVENASLDYGFKFVLKWRP